MEKHGFWNCASRDFIRIDGCGLYRSWGRSAGKDAPRDGIVLITEDISEGPNYCSDGVENAVFEVDHSPIKPTLG